MPLTKMLGANDILRMALIWVVVAGNSGVASAQYKVVLNPNRCVPPTAAQLKWLPLEWQAYTEYVRVCSVRNLQKKSIMLVASVRADLYYKAQPGQSVPLVVLPSPLLFLPAGQISGTLPYNFPDDPPAELRVTFTRWEQGFPRRIELFLTDPRASGNRSLPPLEWNDAEKKFRSKEETPRG